MKRLSLLFGLLLTSLLLAACDTDKPKPGSAAFSENQILSSICGSRQAYGHNLPAFEAGTLIGVLNAMNRRFE